MAVTSLFRIAGFLALAAATSVAILFASSHTGLELRHDDVVRLWEKAVIPGSLSKAHAALDGAGSACHTPMLGVDDGKCVSCHADNQALLQRQPTCFIRASRAARIATLNTLVGHMSRAVWIILRWPGSGCGGARPDHRRADTIGWRRHFTDSEASATSSCRVGSSSGGRSHSTLSGPWIELSPAHGAEHRGEVAGGVAEAGVHAAPTARWLGGLPPNESVDPRPRVSSTALAS